MLKAVHGMSPSPLPHLGPLRHWCLTTCQLSSNSWTVNKGDHGRIPHYLQHPAKAGRSPQDPHCTQHPLLQAGRDSSTPAGPYTDPDDEDLVECHSGIPGAINSHHQVDLIHCAGLDTVCPWLGLAQNGSIFVTPAGSPLTPNILLSTLTIALTVTGIVKHSNIWHHRHQRQ